MNETYVQSAHDVPVGFDATGEALEEPSSSSVFCATAPRAPTAGSAFVLERQYYPEVFGGVAEPICDILVVPEVVDHGAGLPAPLLAVVPDVCEVSSDYLAHTQRPASLDKSMDVGVDLLPEPEPTGSIELLEPPRGLPAIYGCQGGFVTCYLLVPVPPIGEQRCAVIGQGLPLALDIAGYDAPHSEVNVCPLVSHWLMQRLCPYWLVGVPPLPEFIILNFEGALLSVPLGLPEYPALDLLWEFDPSSLDLVAVVADEDYESAPPHIAVFPVSRRSDILDVAWKIVCFFSLEKCEEGLPSLIILPYDLLGCCGANSGGELSVLIVRIPIDLSREEALSSPVVHGVPESGAVVGELEHPPVIAVKFDAEGICPSHCYRIQHCGYIYLTGERMKSTQFIPPLKGVGFLEEVW